MSLSRRELKELEETIAKITTENLKAMVGPDRPKHSREVLEAAERELKKREVEAAPGAKESAGVPLDGDPAPVRTGGVSGGALLSD